MKFIPAQVSEAAALRYFERRRPGNLWGLLKLRRRPTAVEAGKKFGRVPSVELIWLPYYIISIRLRSKSGPTPITVSVEGHSGAFAILQMAEDLVEGEPEGETFTPKLGEQQAIEMGRKGLLRSILARRGQRDKPLIEDTLTVDLFLHPYWVYYYERRRGLLDIRVLNALTCEKGGPKIKAAILSAFTGSDKSKDTKSGQHH